MYATYGTRDSVIRRDSQALISNFLRNRRKHDFLLVYQGLIYKKRFFFMQQWASLPAVSSLVPQINILNRSPLVDK